MRYAFTIAAMATLAACSPSKSPPKIPLTAEGAVAPAGGDSTRAAEQAHALIGPEARAALDSGNALFRKKAYAAALARYREASDLAPQHAAPLFGIYMVARATNNTVLADSALLGIKQRNGPVPTNSHTFADSMLKRVHANVKKPVGS